MKKLFLLFVVVFSMISITGCLGFQSPQEKIQTTLEMVVEKEAPFAKQQEPLVQLETKEQELYEQILVASEESHQEVVKLVDEAIAHINKRKELMNIEQKSIEGSRAEFQKVQNNIEDIENKKLRKQADKLYDIMMDRYKAHDELYKWYTAGLESDQMLYELLKEESPSIERLEQQIESINNTYGKVMSANDKFNQLTKEYNQSKHVFYDLAGLTNTNSK